MWWIWALLIVLLVGVLILVSKIETTVTIKRVGDNDHISIWFRALYGMVRYHYEVPMIKFKGIWEGFNYKSEHSEFLGTQKVKENDIPLVRIKEGLEDALTVMKHTYGMLDWIKAMLRHVNCTRLQWNTHIGTQDAAETAISTGGAWAVKSWLLGYIFRYVRLDTEPRISVNPQYNQKIFATEAKFTCTISTGIALYSGLRLYMRVRKEKEGIRVWKRVFLKRKRSLASP